MFFFFFSSRRRHTRCYRDWSSDVCSSDLLSCTRPDREQLLQLNDVLVKACANDPKKRYDSAADMHRDLRALERGERPKRSRAKVLIATISILAVALGGVWFWSQRPQPNAELHLQ